MSTTAPAAVRPVRRVGRASRIGLVLASLMALANVSNGAMSLVDPTAGQLDPTIAPQPVWISLTLLALGLGTLVAVHRLDNDRCAIVKVNDRMHNRHRQRVIDVSRGVAEYLDMVRAGVVMVRVVALPGKGARRDAGTCRSAVEAAADWQSADEFSPRRGQPEKMPEIEIGPAD